MSATPPRETPISAQEAEANHAIRAAHGQLPNGELRFRLRKSDGTAYIRTERLTGGWQESHFHVKVQETYIVQSGSMIIARKHGEGALFHEYHAGEIVTIADGDIHNVFLGDNTVIHTVKHGDATAEDRTVNAATKAFDQYLNALAPADVQRNITRQTAAEPPMSDDYKHFDGLIWQAPAWSSAIFALSGPVLLATNQEAIKEFTGLMGVSERALISGLFLLLAAVMASFGWMLYRFRWHQVPTRRRPFGRLSSAQRLSQLLIAFEMWALTFAGIATVGKATVFGAVVFAAIPSFGLFLFEEVRLSHRHKVNAPAPAPTAARPI